MKRVLDQLAIMLVILGILLFLTPSLSFAQENLATKFENRDIDRYKQQVERMSQGNVDLLWVGDSITHFWETSGKDIWKQYYGNRNAVNFAISGDRTGHVLWRIANSPMDKISPKMTVVMIGTNNIGHKKNNSNLMHSSPTETVEGIQKIVEQLKNLYPKTKILLLEVFPRGNKADDPLRVAVNEINRGLETIYANNAVEQVQLYSINDLFLDENGELPKEIMPDFLHPSAKGYEIWAKAIEPMIADGLEENSIDTLAVPVEAEWWSKRFNEKNELLKKGNIDILMLGDSITHGWENSGKLVWQKYYGDKRAINLGHGGDQTQHLLWRIENYDFSNVNPKVAVLLIGVNNTWGRDREAKNIALGQRRIVKKLRSLFPKMKINILNIFPCTSQQDCIDAINELIPFYMRDIPNVEVIDINRVFLNENKMLTKEVMPDLLHPNEVGYESWGAALYLVLEKATK